MDIKFYHTLHKDAVKIRKEVFMEEQGFHDEFDEKDKSDVHLVLYIDQVPAATCRFFPDRHRVNISSGGSALKKNSAEIISVPGSFPPPNPRSGTLAATPSACTPGSRQIHSMKNRVILFSGNRILMRTARISGWRNQCSIPRSGCKNGNFGQRSKYSICTLRDRWTLPAN